MFSVLADQRIEDILQDSEIEDFVPSDDDLGDTEYLVDNEQESSSSSEFSSESSSESTEIPPPSSRGRERQRGTTARRARGSRSSRIERNSPSNWSVKTFLPVTNQLLGPAYLPIELESFDPVNYIKQYIDDDIVSLIVEKTNQTAVFKTGKSLDLCMNECYLYIGICLVMASINYPQLRMYWEKKFRVALVANCMSRNRFLALRNSLKIVFDQDITMECKSKDKLWRVRPLIERIRTGCRAQLKQQFLSIDEMIIPFTGNCGIRIYCPGKPNPVGIKAFVLANPDGMICDFHIYEGSTTYPEFENTNFGLGEKAVLLLTETLVPGHIIYCDRYFTSEKLIDELRTRGLGCTGTLMKNRIPKEVRALLLSDKELKRRGRGTSHVVVRNDDKISVTKWFDNKPVIMMSSVEAQEAPDTCQRWCKQLKRYLTINRPRCIRQYNQNMGGVDLADRLLAVCPNRYRTRKWTQRFIAHMIDLSITNSWILLKSDQRRNGSRKIPQLRQFKLQLGEYLIEKYNQRENEPDEENVQEVVPPKKSRGMPSVPLPSTGQRTAHAKHLPTFSTVQGRCRLCHENKTFFECSSCNVRLCITKKRNCFAAFHSA